MPGPVEAARVEVMRVTALARSLNATEWSTPSRCEGWTVADVVAHLATDFARYSEWLQQSQAGALTPPFPPSHFRADNAMLLESYDGVSGPGRLAELERAAEAWFARIDGLDLEIPQRHPRGTITLQTQIWFAAGECAIHGWDIASAIVREWDPPAAIDGIVAARSAFEPVPDGDSWLGLLKLSGRRP